MVRLFFTNPPLYDGEGRGLWIAEHSDFSHYIRQRFLKNYQPQAHENSPEVIENLLKDSDLFFRMENPFVYQLFVVRHYNLSASQGKLYPYKNSSRFILRLLKRDGQGREYVEESVLVYEKENRLWYYLTDGYRIRLRAERRESSELVQYYADPFRAPLREY